MAIISSLKSLLILIITDFWYSYLDSNQCFRELGLQEAMCLQKEGDVTSTYERIISLQEEIENYK
jgi:hypothetical protein